MALRDPALDAFDQLKVREVGTWSSDTASTFLARFHSAAASLEPDERIQLEVIYNNVELLTTVLADPQANKICALRWKYDGKEDVNSVIPLLLNNCPELASVEVKFRHLSEFDFVSSVLEHSSNKVKVLVMPRYTKGNTPRFFAALGQSQVSALNLDSCGSPEFYQGLCEYLAKDLLVRLKLSSETMMSLAKCTRLSELQLTGCTFSQPITYLPKSITKLVLNDCTFVDGFDSSFLAGSNVRELDFFCVEGVNGDQLGGAVAAHLRAKGLDKLRLGACDFVNETLAAAGVEIRRIKILDLEDSNLDDASVELIALALQSPNNEMKELKLSYDDDTASSIETHLLPALKHPNCNLAELSLWTYEPEREAAAETVEHQLRNRRALFALLQGQQVRRKRPCLLQRLPVEMFRRADTSHTSPMERSLLARTAALETKDDGERTRTLRELGDVLDNPQTKKTGSQAVLNNKAVMDVLLNLAATTRSAGVAADVLYVLLRLTREDDHQRRLFREHPSVVPAVMRRLEFGADNATKDVQLKALSVLQGLAINDDNKREMTNNNPTLVPRLLAMVDSNPEQAQAELMLRNSLAYNVDNRREMVTVLLPMLLARMGSNSEDVQIMALDVLSILAREIDNKRELVTRLFPLLVIKLEFSSEQVQVMALNMLNNLIGDVVNRHEIVIENPMLVPLLLAKMGSNSEQMQGKALIMLWALSFNTVNVREMVTKNPSLVPVLVAKLESNLKHVREAALGMLNNLASNVDNACDMVAENPMLVPLVITNAEANLELVQVEALEVLQRLALNVDNAREMFTKNPTLVPLLVVKVGSNWEQVQAGALDVLRNLAHNLDNKREMATKNLTLVPVLVAKLESDLERAQVKALNVLWVLSFNVENVREMFTKNPTLVPVLVAKLESNSKQAQEEVLGTLNNLANDDDNARDMATKNPTLVPLLVAKVEADSEQVQVAALEVLQGLTLNVDNACDMTALVPLLVVKLESNSKEVQEGALNVLHSLTCNIDIARDMAIQYATLVPQLLVKMESTSEQVRDRAFAVLGHLAFDPNNAREMVTKNPELVPLLVTKMESNLVKVRARALGVLSFLAFDGDNAYEMFTENHVLVPLLMDKVGSSSDQVKALEVLGNLAYSNAREMVTQHPTLVPLLVAKVEFDLEQVQAAALNVLYYLAYNVDNAREMATTFISLLVEKMSGSTCLESTKVVYQLSCSPTNRAILRGNNAVVAALAKGREDDTHLFSLLALVNLFGAEKDSKVLKTDLAMLQQVFDLIARAINRHGWELNEPLLAFRCLCVVERNRQLLWGKYGSEFLTSIFDALQQAIYDEDTPAVENAVFTLAQFSNDPEPLAWMRSNTPELNEAIEQLAPFPEALKTAQALLLAVAPSPKQSVPQNEAEVRQWLSTHEHGQEIADRLIKEDLVEDLKAMSDLSPSELMTVISFSAKQASSLHAALKELF